MSTSHGSFVWHELITSDPAAAMAFYGNVVGWSAQHAPVPGMDKKPHSGFSATTTINRKDFGVGPAVPVAVVGDEIKLTIELEVVKQ